MTYLIPVIVGGIIIVSVLHGIARLAQASTLLEEKPAYLTSFHVDRSPSEVFAALYRLAEAAGYRVEIADLERQCIILSEPASLSSFGFFFPVYCEVEGAQTRLEVGAKSRLLQDNEGNPIRAFALTRFIERARDLLEARSAYATPSVSEASTRALIGSTAMMFLVLGVLNLGGFLEASAAVPISPSGSAVLLRTLLGGAFLLYLVSAPESYGKVFWALLALGCLVGALSHAARGWFASEDFVRIMGGVAYVLLGLVTVSLFVMTRHRRICLFG